MTSVDAGVVVGAVQWSEEGSYVREVAARGPLPQLAKVIKGQYLGVGVPSLSNPGVSPTLLLLSAGKGLRVTAQSVKFKEARKVVPVGPRLAIPENFDGFFEILSEDGKAVRCIEGVAELAKRFPDSCLVREALKAFVSRSDDAETITDKARLVQIGETLTLVGEVLGTKASSNGGSKLQHRYLRCFDQAGHNVYLPYEGKGKFSAIAKEDNISGVHSIRNLLNKRLPLMVRMVHGQPPVGTKHISSHFLPELRLYASANDEVLAALPLGKEAPLVFLPQSAPLKLAHARNPEQLEKTKEFLRLCERAATLLQAAADKMYVFDTTTQGNKSGLRDPRFMPIPQPKVRHKGTHPHIKGLSVAKSPPDVTLNGAEGDDYDEIDQIYDYVRGFAPLPKHIRSPFTHSNGTNTGEMEASRRLSISLSPLSAEKKLDSRSSVDIRPTPPPIETIPTRRLTVDKLSPSVHPALISAALDRATERRVEKRTRTPSDAAFCRSQPLLNTATPTRSHFLRPLSQENQPVTHKLFVKASQQRGTTKSRIFRRSSASPSTDYNVEVVSIGPGGLGSTKSPSPIFKLRYKSLTNLAMDFDTLDSSTSGGKTSADSGGSAAIKAKLPEKKSRRLSRPKSLTNLVWVGATSADPLVNGRASRAVMEAERKMRLEPGVYRHSREAPTFLSSNRMQLPQKKIGTLYL